MHPTLSSSIGIVPWPKYAPVRAMEPVYELLYFRFRFILLIIYLPDVENPNCLQTTRASYELHKSSQTVPHMLLTQTSTRPSREEEPPTSLTVPLVQAKKMSMHCIYFMAIN